MDVKNVHDLQCFSAVWQPLSNHRSARRAATSRESRLSDNDAAVNTAIQHRRICARALK
jgi:hypothetical protein